eukprot:429760-Amphidinium_carterae.1
MVGGDVGQDATLCTRLNAMQEKMLVGSQVMEKAMQQEQDPLLVAIERLVQIAALRFNQRIRNPETKQ